MEELEQKMNKEQNWKKKLLIFDEIYLEDRL